MWIQPFKILVEWPEIGCLMEVSIMFDTVFAHTAFLLCTVDMIYAACQAMGPAFVVRFYRQSISKGQRPLLQ